MSKSTLNKKTEQAIEALIEKGRELGGSLGFDEINAALTVAAQGKNALETLTEVLDRLEVAGIRVGDAGEPQEAPQLTAPMPVATCAVCTDETRGRSP